MKKLIALFLLAATAAFGANALIRDLSTTVVLPSSNTYLIVDGATQGTGKFVLANVPQVTSTRTTLAALSVTGISTGVTVQTLGGAAIADGSSTLYYYNSASSATPNGTTVIQPTVGSGRWLSVASSNLPAPSLSTLGGVFSKAGVAHQYLSALDTAGNFTLSTVAATDVSGLGSMSLQNSATVMITGGSVSVSTLDGILGSFFPAAATVTSLTAQTSAVVGTGAASSTRTVVINGGSNTNTGSYLEFQQASVSGHRIGVDGPITGNSLTDLALMAKAGSIIRFYVNASSTSVGNIASNGFNGAIGQGSPNLGSFTTLSGSVTATGSPTARTLANRFATIINVKDFGAVGDGATNDTAAINAAIAALTNYSNLYFPRGNYLFSAGSLSSIANVSYVRIHGDGSRLYSSATGASGNFLTVDATSSHIDIDNLGFVGSATVRGNGIGIRLGSSYSSITNCYFSGMSDFAIHVSAGSAYSRYVNVSDNIINASLGDGIHIGSSENVTITGNNIANTGDDGIGIIADNASFPPNRVNVVGNLIYNTSSAGIRINEANDILVEANSVQITTACGIEVNRYLSTTAYNSRVHIKGNKLVNVVTVPGPRGAIWMNFCNESSVTENEVYDPANGAGIMLLDFNDMTVRGNTVRGSPVRAIALDDSTTTNVAANWYGLVIDANVIQYNVSNEAIYIVPAVGKAVNNVLITSNVGNQLPSGNWIYYDRVNTGKVGNNTSRDGRAVAAGGTVTGMTAFNNN